MNLVGNWSESDAQALACGVYDINKRLIDATTSASIFEQTFAGLYYSLNRRLRYLADADKRRIVFKPGFVTYELVIHEFWHVFAARLWPGGPVAYLRNNGIYTSDGQFLTGRQPPYAYNRNNRVPAPDNGYVSDKWRDGYQLHPRNMSGDESGNCAAEDFADIAANYTRETFVDNVAGNTLYAWMDFNIKVWLQV